MTTINAQDGKQVYQEVKSAATETPLKWAKKAQEGVNNLAAELSGTAMESVKFGLDMAKTIDPVGPTVRKIASEVGLYDGDSGNNSTALGAIMEELFKGFSDPFGTLSEMVSEVSNFMKKLLNW